MINTSIPLPELTKKDFAQAHQKVNRSAISLLLLVIVALVIEYYLPAFFAVIFYLVLLYRYNQSQNEPFWLAFFLVVSDGFMGFFGAYTLTFAVLPGLPAIELSQVYVLLTILKASNKQVKTKLFYSGYLKIFLIWILFLVIQGYVLGLSTSLNVQLRLLKVTLPFALFYSIPKLFDGETDYIRFFKYLFPIAISALIAQVITISQGAPPMHILGLASEEFLVFGEKSDLIYRVLYSQKTLLITLFAALFYLAKKESDFNRIYLFIIVFCNYLTVYLSATRGWFICFTFVISTSLLFAIRTSFKSLMSVFLFMICLFVILKTTPALNTQITNASERLATIQLLASSDSDQTKSFGRLSVRSPRVLKKWRESKLTGWGYSDTFFNYADIHVANQNMMLHGGIIGLSLFWIFILFFIVNILNSQFKLDIKSPIKKSMLVPVFFLMGWLIIHSTSGQHFNLSTHPSSAIPQVIFFCFSGLLYNQAKEHISGHTLNYRHPFPTSRVW